MNFAWQEERVFENVSEAPGDFDWAASMDATRHACGNDTPYRGKPARTFKHFVMSPDPQDGLTADQVAELASAWALKHFSDFEVAIVLHDDNENRIPHAHIVVNNTNLATERRLQTPDPLELNRSLQDLAEERGLRFMRDEVVRECEEEPARKKMPATMQKTYIRRAEKEIASEGGYSWVSDIRNRVTVAKALARNEDEFIAVLKPLRSRCREELGTLLETRLDLLARRPPHLAHRRREAGAVLRAGGTQEPLRQDCRLAPHPGSITPDPLSGRTCRRAERPGGTAAAGRCDRDVHVLERPQPRGPRQEDQKARVPWRCGLRRSGERSARGAGVHGPGKAAARDFADEAAKAAAERGRSPQARRSGAAEPESTSASGQAAR